MALSKIINGGVAASGIPSGGIIQVQYTQFTGTNTVAFSASTDATLTDLTVNITPTSTSSIIKIEALVQGEWGHVDQSTDSCWFFLRDSTKLGSATSGDRNVGIHMGTSVTYYSANASSTPEGVKYVYFDSPSTTSQITYKVAARGVNATNFYLNRTVADSDHNYIERGISSIIVTEIAG
jgi:hypothetical protein